MATRRLLNPTTIHQAADQYQDLNNTFVSHPSVETTIWTLTTAFGIFLYQLSTVLVVRAKTGNAGNFALKQILNFAVGILAWYLVGYAFTYGASINKALRNKYIGNYVYALHRIRESAHNSTSFGYAWFIQAFAYAMVCNSIVAAVLGGRSSVAAHVLSTIYTVGVLYPVIAHWVWSTEGWLTAYKPATMRPLGGIGTIDVAGSGVVHLLGASISLAASLFLKKKDAPKAASEDSLSLTLAYFLKTFAMYSFVTGSTISIDPAWARGTLGQWNEDQPSKKNGNSGFAFILSADRRVDASNLMFQSVGRAAVCLTLSVGMSILIVLFLESLMSKEVNLTQAVNALVVGFASISSNVVTCEPWAAVLAGLVGGVIYVGGRRICKGLKDGDVFAMHGLGGIWGLFFTGFLAKPKFVRDVIGGYMYPSRWEGQMVGQDYNGISAAPYGAGVFYPAEGPNGRLLGCVILEMVVVFFWGFLLALPLFGILSAIKKLSEKSAEGSK